MNTEQHLHNRSRVARTPIMKTAEDWLTDPSVKQRQTESDVVEWIQAVQLDAIKHGMTLAAEAAKEKSLDHFASMEGSDWKEFVTEEFFCEVMARYHDHVIQLRDNFKL